MRWVLLTICGGLVIAGAVVATAATSPRKLAAQPGMSMVGGDKAALGKSIREYLMANPEVLVEAMQELEKKQDSQRDAVAQKGVQDNQSELYRDPDSPVGGNPSGDVTIVEFNDYQCPYCKRAYQAMKSVTGSDGKVRIVYKDLPILGDASKIAAQAALASVKQGKKIAMPLNKSNLLPKAVVQMISAGEESGKLGEVLDQVVEGGTRFVEPANGVVVYLAGAFAVDHEHIVELSGFDHGTGKVYGVYKTQTRIAKVVVHAGTRQTKRVMHRDRARWFEPLATDRSVDNETDLRTIDARVDDGLLARQRCCLHERHSSRPRASLFDAS